ncbi:hypothetical protein JCGZ_01102 [Jatropha curcas]|uniref:Methyltransferase type 11 domain-containing protein n=1 Tax=Jatropha curcas TaxID=180498 RepID=A0A067L4C0_JATCU|nr:eEF1A lysine and N-terminal methyltransferase [Jatropha curcas]KDP39345.1 hypothetical protein JCGZ_01102 [Jatropha curcas]
MGKRDKKPLQSSSSDELLNTLGDFTSKENWDKFFTIRGSDDSFEWYAEWTELRQPLLSLLLDGAPSSADNDSIPPTSSLQLLVPGCGNSRLSEHLYDAGVKDITNIDFSKVVISDMLRRNVRERPGMRWRVMDMTAMQFADETFDAVVDKGGLDALMEPELGPMLGSQYLTEVQRVLKSGGKFICLTLAESHVLGLLFSKFRFGWKMKVGAVPHKPSTKPSLRTFMVVAEKEISTDLHQITTSVNHCFLDSSGNQAAGLHEALENENRIRREYASSDILYSLEDLQLGAKGDLTKLSPGRRFQLTLGGLGGSCFTYRAVLLDARDLSVSFSYHCGVFIVPKTRAHEWLFSSEEGQWMVVESSKAARLIMVLLDSSHINTSMDDIQKDLSPLVKQLAPGKDDNGAQIPFMMANDGIKQRSIVHKVTSSLTGPIIVEDVVYENVDGDISRFLPSKDLIFRRLVFQRTEGLVQSEALLKGGEYSPKITEIDRKKTTSSSKSKRRGNHKRNDESSNRLKVYHDYLASSYHTGIISGFMLISSYLESVASAGNMANAVVIGLGAGLLPMFLHRCMPFLHIEVVELDHMILDLARGYFGLTEDKHLKVHIADGIKFVREVKHFGTGDGLPVFQSDKDASGSSQPSSNGSCFMSHAEGGMSCGVDILIIDVDSSDSSSGMTCPAADFVEESFLLTVKDSLSQHGLFVVNLVSRSSAIKDMVISRMKTVFSQLFCLQLEEDVNIVLFGLCSELRMKEDSFPEAALQLEKLLKLNHPEISENIVDTAKKIKRLK